MSNEKQETIADIVKEMRNLGLLDEKSTDKIPRSLQALGLRTYADRIEAAAKREVYELKREVAELRECLKETMVDAVAEYKNNSCFRNVKCGEIKRCDTCKVMKWRKALKGACND